MSRRAASFVLGLALALILGGGLWWWLSGRPSRPAGGAAGTAAQKSEPVSFDLYFPSGGGGLRAESRALQVSQEPKDRIRKVVEALLAGPKTPGLARPFPEGVALGSVLLSPDGTAYVDLHWQDHADPPPSGSTEEIQRVYSLVNSIVLDVPQASRVVLLWNGFQRETFSGHLDLSVPLVPDRGL
ncbi:MAG TPA: GerMN domain-containing protein [Thermoanaerobaculia bacterium]|jgi:spore germination protein GerM|nr:GerMN domain-containing protein [Thermoanaerobaculia bacterium]